MSDGAVARCEGGPLDGREIVIRGMHLVLARLHGMLAGVEPWDEHTMETAGMIADWWETRRA